jgi:hypothetical protein
MEKENITVKNWQKLKNILIWKMKRKEILLNQLIFFWEKNVINDVHFYTKSKICIYKKEIKKSDVILHFTLKPKKKEEISVLIDF